VSPHVWPQSTRRSRTPRARFPDRSPGHTDHLLSRFSFGPTEASRAYVEKNGIQGWYDKQVEYGATYRGYDGNAHVAALGPLLAMSPYDVREYLRQEDNEFGWDAMDQLTQVTLGLQAWSKAQLYETLVDFFSNHLNVPNHNGDVWNTRHAYDRDVIPQAPRWARSRACCSRPRSTRRC